MASPKTNTELLELVRRSGVLKPDTLAEFLSSHPTLPDDPKATLNLLTSSKLITGFQAKLLQAGRYKGFRLGAYLLLDQIGQGGMGAVYLAKHEKLNRKAAIKVLPPGGKQLAIERFLREARAAAALDHPNIVRLHDVGQEGDIHFLVMEYVDGKTLDTVVNESGTIPAQKAVEYVAQAAAGLQHAFERGFIHRDIKPANLILSKDGTVKILDMGLARSFEQSDQLTELLDQGAIVGTADYISPEQAINDPNVDIRTDIYGLGATFFAIVTGRPPFDGPTASKLLQHQVKDAPSITSMDKTFPRGLATVIARMMAKKPADRYQTPADLIHALEPWLTESPKLTAGINATESAQKGSLSKLSGSSAKRPDKPAKQGSKAMLWSLLGGIAIVAILGVALTVIFMVGDKDKDKVQTTTPTQPTTETTPTTAATTPTTKVKSPTTKTPPPTTKPVVVIPPTTAAIYDFQAMSLKEFRVVKEKNTTVDGDPVTLPKGLQIQAYKQDAQSEFARSIYNNKPALSLVNIKEPISGQIVWDLERVLDTALPVDRQYIATIEYATSGTAHGNFNVQVQYIYTKVDGLKLENTEGKYLRKTLKFIRKPNELLRIAVDNLVLGKENGVYISKLEIVEDVSTPITPVANRELFNLKLDEKSVRTSYETKLNETTLKAFSVELMPRVGEGIMPRGWSARAMEVGAQAEMEITQIDGERALGFRGSRAGAKPGATLLFTQSIEVPSSVCRISFEYKTSAKDGTCKLKYKPEGENARDIAKLTTPASGWSKYEQILDLKDSRAGHWEFVNGGEVNEELWLRKLVITELTKADVKK